MFNFSPPSDVYMSYEKDLSAISQLRDHVRESINSVQRIIGMNTNSHHDIQQEIALLSKIIFYSLTTLRGRSTLGEEYCDLMLVKVPQAPPVPLFPQASKDLPLIKTNSSPSLLTNRDALLFILLECLVPYIYSKIRKKGRIIEEPNLNILLTEDESQNKNKFILYFNFLIKLFKKLLIRSWNSLVYIILYGDDYFNFFFKFHLMLFYANGKFLLFSNRILSLQNLKTRRIPQPPQAQIINNQSNKGQSQGPPPVPGHNHLYLLAYLIAIQLTITSIGNIKQLLTQLFYKIKNYLNPPQPLNNSSMQNNNNNSSSSDNDDNESDENGNSQSKISCTLCLSNLTNSTITECGHVYCWSCIAESINNKPECPLCRQSCTANSLLLLANY